jgi:hypothetical protein
VLERASTDRGSRRRLAFECFAAEAGLLDAAERRNFGSDQRLVDANHAEFEDGRDTEDAPKVASVEVACKPSLRIFCDLHGFALKR